MIKNVFEIAKELAALKHAGQMYGAMPYMYHLNAVVTSVANKWGWENRSILAVAILHDILEDTDLTYEELVSAVGKDIAVYVKGLTKIEGEEYHAYIERCREHHYTKEVKIHDTLCNLTESIKADSRSRVKKYANQLQLLVA